MSTDSKDITQPLRKSSSYICFPKSKENNTKLILRKAWLHWTSIYTRVNEQNMALSLPPHVCFLLVKCPRSSTVKICIILDSVIISDQILFIHVHGTHWLLWDTCASQEHHMFNNLKNATIMQKQASVYLLMHCSWTHFLASPSRAQVPPSSIFRESILIFPYQYAAKPH